MLSQKRRNLEVMFGIFDVTQDGFITPDDFASHADSTCAALRLAEGSPHWHTIHRALESWWQHLRENARVTNGRIPTGECVAIMADRLVDDEPFFSSTIGPIAETIFRVLDSDGDDWISEGEFVQVYVASGLTEEVAVEAFGKIDANSDGRIGIAEFVQVVREAFTSADPDSPGAWFFGVPVRGKETAG
ncbi:MAG TPA: EF-hand domain-containing protein [Amycolatopsis sp.]|jgi:Ca2+-binding EF-hand superfamily protein|nr:EF-hand domain-containing protein [Amycolatopsis sp.]